MTLFEMAYEKNMYNKILAVHVNRKIMLITSPIFSFHLVPP